MARTRIPQGSIADLWVEFTDPTSGEYTDPSSVVLRYRAPSGAAYSSTYGGAYGESMSKTGIGRYVYKLPLSQEGTYYWKWTGSNGSVAAIVVPGELDATSTPDY